MVKARKLLTHLDPSLEILLNEMVNYPTRDNVLPKYQMVLKKINSILNEIKNCDSEAQADQFFDLLEEIHSPLAILVFKEKINEYPRINKFVSDFDRIDDQRLRASMFRDIKENNYSLEK